MMQGTETIIFSMFIIFAGAAFMSTLALFTRQSMLVAYIIIGTIMGPFGFAFIGNGDLMREIGSVGIIFLLFLLGLYLRPQSLIQLLGRTVGVAVVTSLLFALIGFGMAISFGFTEAESVVIGISMMFSSTIIGLKLLPTTMLQHRHSGDVMISILLLQDLIAIVALLVLHLMATGIVSWKHVSLITLSLPVLMLFAYLMQRLILLPLINRFNEIKEYTFLIAVAWCLGMAQLAGLMGLSEGIGAFIGGVSLAANPIAEYLAEHLRPLRDFFLIIFFFCIGINFEYQYLTKIFFPTLMLAMVVLVVKPLIFRFCLRRVHEMQMIATEVGMRLGQTSEFSLMIAYMAEKTNLIGHGASSLIQATAIVTFIVSSYLVVLIYPTPMAVCSKLRRE